MDDLLQSQISESCRLALPAGLQELMSDISREVLRSQPADIYQFIAYYLESLLIAREALSIACHICGEVSDCSCPPQLEDELRRIGLSEDEVVKAKNIILDYFDKGQVQETSLLLKLATQMSVTETQLAKLQKAIRKAFQRHITKRKGLRVSFVKYDDDSTERSQECSMTSVSTQSSASDFYRPSFALGAEATLENAQAKYMFPRETYSECNMSVSATTLAGSHVDLPLRIPYSVHNSDCEKIMIKSEKSVLSLLKSILLAEDQPYPRFKDYEDKYGPITSPDSIDSRNTVSEEIDDTIRSIFNRDISDVRPKSSQDTQNLAIFKAIQENLNESSSGGS